MATTYAELCDRVRDQLVAALKTANANGWEQPWTLGNLGAGVPANASTGKRYRGMNAWWLFAQGYDTPWFATFKQWLTLGYCVRKGEHGHQCVKWVDRKPTKAQLKAGEKVPKGLLPVTFTVFHFSQVGELDTFEGERWQVPAKFTGEFAVNEEARRFFEQVGATVFHGGSRAYYSPVADEIQMPASTDFTSTEGYYSTLGHEHGHWTGHESRLNRDLKGRFGSSGYAMEELVAEMTAAFTMAHLGLAAYPRKDHADYLANWLEVLEGDSKAVYAAAKAASDAFEFLVGSTEPASTPDHELVAA